MDMSKSNFDSVSPEKIHRQISRQRNHYDVLGVSSSVSSMGIREAYFRLKNTYARSNQALYSLISDEGVDDAMKEIELAYETLVSSHLRQSYDRENNITSYIPRSEEYKSHSTGFQRNDGDRIKFIREQTHLKKELERPASEGAFFKPTTAYKGKRISRIAMNVKSEEFQEKIKTIFSTSESITGGVFKKIRESANISIIEVQENTKISLGIIQAIEGDNFETMPQVSYAKGFLQSYLKYLGVLDSKEVITSFIERYESWINQQK